ncbi:MAG: prolipoprotein diacylglyceryl transferase family protein [Candidatus Peregrinibacteria bacterium]
MDLSEIVLGPFVFSTGAMVLLIGIMISSWMLARTVHEKKLSIRFLNDYFLLYLVVGVLMGRAGAVLDIWPTISENMMHTAGTGEAVLVFLRDTVSFWQGGVDFLWAGIGFFITFLVLCFLRNENILSWLDAFSLPLLLLFVFLEIGSFLAGWDYGAPVDENFIFAISYDLTDVRYSGYIHPVQLYAAIAFGLLFVGGMVLWSEKLEKQWQSGIFGGIFLSATFMVNGILEFFRGEKGTLLFNDSVPLSQLLSFGLGILIFSFMIWKGHFQVFSKLRTFSHLS